MKIIYYYHIPKCGGTHIMRHMRKLAETVNGEYYNFNEAMNTYNFWETIISNIRLRYFLRNINRGDADFKFVHHHHGYYGMSEIKHLLLREKDKAKSLGNEFYLFTCIRDPISFQLSRVNFLRNTGKQPQLSFDEVIDNPKNHNVMYKYFMNNHPKRWRDPNLDKSHFTDILGVMDDVFVLEDIDDLINNMESIVGTQAPHATKKANQGKHHIVPTTSQIEKLERANHLDRYFYELIKSNSN